MPHAENPLDKIVATALIHDLVLVTAQAQSARGDGGLLWYYHQAAARVAGELDQYLTIRESNHRPTDTNQLLRACNIASKSRKDVADLRIGCGASEIVQCKPCTLER